MPGSRRNGLVISKLGATLLPGTGYKVNVLPPGGIATNPPSGATIPLEGGHGFSGGLGQKILVYTKATGAWTYYGGVTVSTVAAQSITMSAVAVMVIADGDTIFNLGADTSIASTPNWNGQGVSIYTDIELTDAIANQLVFTNDEGEYEFCWSGAPVWEVIRKTNGDPVDFNLDVMGPISNRSGFALPAAGEFPGQEFLLRAQGGAGSKKFTWAEDENGFFDWIQDVEYVSS